MPLQAHIGSCGRWEQLEIADMFQAQSAAYISSQSLGKQLLIQKKYI